MTSESPPSGLQELNDLPLPCFLATDFQDMNQQLHFCLETSRAARLQPFVFRPGQLQSHAGSLRMDQQFQCHLTDLSPPPPAKQWGHSATDSSCCCNKQGNKATAAAQHWLTCKYCWHAPVPTHKRLPQQGWIYTAWFK